VPLSLNALMRAIELNAAAVDMNKAAFNWGRVAAHDIAQVRDAIGGKSTTSSGEMALDDSRLSMTLEQRIARRAAFLTDYQNAAYAQKYKAFVENVRNAEQAKVPGSTALTEAVARYAFKLMAYKDEYEVARLYTSGDFEKRVRDTFDGDYKIHFHLAPPLFARRDAEGKLRKAEYGSWVFGAFKLLAKLRGLRGTAFDVFGYTDERKHERALIAEYFATVDELLSKLDRSNIALAVEIASLPEQIRGYGHVKDKHLATVQPKREQLLEAWRNPRVATAAA
jgi:indolepyruvate ferredoxin oxidoreductase